MLNPDVLGESTHASITIPQPLPNLSEQSAGSSTVYQPSHNVFNFGDDTSDFDEEQALNFDEDQPSGDFLDDSDKGVLSIGDNDDQASDDEASISDCSEDNDHDFEYIEIDGNISDTEIDTEKVSQMLLNGKTSVNLNKLVDDRRDGKTLDFEPNLELAEEARHRV